MTPNCQNPYFRFHAKKMERVAGIEPASSAWKAEVLPLNHTRVPNFPAHFSLGKRSRYKTWWREKDSNLRRHSRQIYSLIPLTARESRQCFNDLRPNTPNPCHTTKPILSLFPSPPAATTGLSQVKWCRHKESNPGPSHYK